MKRKKQNLNKDNDEYITINVDNNLGENTEKVNSTSSRKSTRIGHMNDKKKSKKEPPNSSVTDNIKKKKRKEKSKVNDGTKGLKNWKKWSKKKKIGMGILFFLLFVLIILIIIFSVYLIKAKGNIKDAVLNAASDIVGEQDPIFVLILGVSADISTELTDTIMLCGYNPDTQKAFMLSIPRDTFVGKSEAYANGYDKINAQYQKSAEKTMETVELLTGINIDYYVVVRNISITSIFECIGSVDFDVPINMNYDDPTQDLHIHLKKGYQTLEPDQIEQLLRFRHNNDGSSYPSSYGDNDYGRMRTQREFIKTMMDQMISVQNITKLKDVASMVYTNLQTNMSGYKVLDYIPHGLKFSTSNLRSEQLPGQSELINELWFYKVSKSQTRKLIDELMIYLELDENEVSNYYKYGDDIKGVKPDENYVAENIVIDDDYDSTSSSSSSKKTNTTNKNNVVDQNTCEHQYAVLESKDPDCTTDGSVTYKCILCNKEYTKAVGALGHSYVNGVCSRCNTKQPTLSNATNTVEQSSHTHSYVKSQEVIKQPTVDSEGILRKYCSCGEYKDYPIDKLQNTQQDPVDNDNKEEMKNEVNDPPASTNQVVEESQSEGNVVN